MNELLRLDNLRVRFGNDRNAVLAVDGVRFCVRERETVVLAGESGSGKTVTALAMTKLIRTNATMITASVHFAGRDLLSLDETQLTQVRGKEISYIFQDPVAFLNPVYTVGDQIAEPLRVHKARSATQAMREAEELLRLVKIADPRRVLAAYPHQLSGGMNQRVMTAIAIACGPKLLIADEPTTALDVTTQREILNLLMELKSARGFALLFITHNLAIAHRIADRLCVMYRGQIVETGSKEAIFHTPGHDHTKKLIAAYEKIGRL